TLNGHIIRGLQDDDPKKLLFRSVFLDTAQLVKIVKGLSHVDPDRVGVIDRHPGVVALKKPDGFSFKKIDGRKKDHSAASNPAKARRIARPTGPLFSG
ncbi:MAG: acetylxylan esterase, partial [Clostridia bacterium]|nr:acetylxylan esterase [Clostridia bacterium]